MFEDIPRPGIWKRLLLGAFLIVFAAAGASAVAGFHEVDKIVGYLEEGKEIKLGKGALAETDPGDPQTLLLLGSDRRPKNNTEGAGGARSDTIMLVRLDPDKAATAVMSLPRDLKVEIPGHGTDKINAAYDLGGPALTLKTVKSVTGLRINHVINVHFTGFWRAVNAVGCVYADIDRRYYNDSAEYTYINVQPGYQRLCGRKALQYVRFRHEDTDIVRAARQQDFLRQAKQQISTSQLIGNRDKLGKIFGRNTNTDGALRSREEVLRLLKLAVGTANMPIQEISFRGALGPSYVETTPEQMQEMTHEFLNVEDTPGPRGEATKRVKRPKRKKLPTAVGGLEDATGYGKEAAILAVQAGAGGTLPVLYPAAGLGLRRAAARVQAARTGWQALRRLPDGAPDRPGGRVLRPAGPDLEEPADPRRSHRDPQDRPPQVRAGLRRRPPAPGRVAHPQGRLLDLQHAAAVARREADAGDRAVGEAALATR
jgi:polyisoprenyl-teichoic acid--peptidoglycan teichoic acid transferase